MTSTSGFNADHRVQFGCGIVLLVVLIAVGAPEGYRRFDARRAVHASLDSVVSVQEGIEEYWRENQHLPASLQEVLHRTTPAMRFVSGVDWNLAGWLTIRYDSVIQERLDMDEEATVVLKASVEDTGVVWSCWYGTVGNWYRPEQCRMAEP